MSRQARSVWVGILCLALLAPGCHPAQPFYLHNDHDLSHYVGVATDIEYPDVDADTLVEVDAALPPLTVENTDWENTWDLPLEEAIRTALANSKVIRSLGGRIGNVDGAPEQLLSAPTQTPSVYDPALEETNPGFSSFARAAGGTGRGAEAALAEFDAQFAASMVWNRNDRQVNTQTTFANLFQQVLEQDQGTFQAQLSKTNATGGTTLLRHNVLYDLNNNPTRVEPSDYDVNFELEVRQPFLQGAGTEFNRIAGPSAIVGNSRGVVLSRINTDITLAGFEANVRDFLAEVEDAYWELYFAYHNLDAVKAGQESAMATWSNVQAKKVQGIVGGDAAQEAQAREQVYLFRAQVVEAFNSLLRSESRLRYLMGIASTDGRLIRPADTPTDAKVYFDWHEIKNEALIRSPELRQQKWRIKQQELELVAAKNFLLPRLDGLALWRVRGLGDQLLSSNRSGNAGLTNSSAYETLTEGEFTEWQLGLTMSMPLGFRQELSNMRHQQLGLARQRSVLQDMELEMISALSDNIRDIDRHYEGMQANLNRRKAAREQVDAVQALYDVGTATIDLLLDAQRRLADAEAAYFRSLVSYNRAITTVHRTKGSLLEYNSVYLSEGPWPGKAYFDARREASKTDSSYYMDYGVTRPGVISRGPVQQGAPVEGDGEVLYETYDSGQPLPEEVPTPTPAPTSALRNQPSRSQMASRHLGEGKFPWGNLGMEAQADTGAIKGRQVSHHRPLSNRHATSPPATPR